MSELVPELQQLLDAARAASAHAYAPYSGFRVGAALRAADGSIYAGCNVENATFGATLCAERTAVAAMVSAGRRELTAIAVFVDAEDPAMPCGICRQTLAEFARDVPVVVAGTGGLFVHSLAEIFPAPFTLKR